MAIGCVLRFSVNSEDEGWAVRQDGDLILVRGEHSDALNVARLLVSGIKACGGDAALLGDEKDR